MIHSIHIGEIIRQVQKDSKLTITAFADKLGTSRNNVYDIFTRESIDTGLLRRISKVLKHDFFQYFTDYHKTSPDKVNQSGIRMTLIIENPNE